MDDYDTVGGMMGKALDGYGTMGDNGRSYGTIGDNIGIYGQDGTMVGDGMSDYGRMDDNEMAGRDMSIHMGTIKKVEPIIKN